VRRLNGVLPHDVRVREVSVAPPGFDARFSPLSRIYRYRICDRPEHLDPLHRHEVVVVSSPLRVAAMNEAAAPLVGLHDFGGFCRRREGATTIRTLLRLGFSRTDDGLVVGTIEADAFCHSMVRSLVGALVDVGQGRRDPAWLEACLRSGERVPAVHVAPAHGLTLEAVVFPDAQELAARATATRNPRGPLHGVPLD
jgi:tRNA pseudouridine38-40 synthase